LLSIWRRCDLAIAFADLLKGSGVEPRSTPAYQGYRKNHWAMGRVCLEKGMRDVIAVGNLR
jgi:hypothetical protein